MLCARELQLTLHKHFEDVGLLPINMALADLILDGIYHHLSIEVVTTTGDIQGVIRSSQESILNQEATDGVCTASKDILRTQRGTFINGGVSGQWLNDERMEST